MFLPLAGQAVVHSVAFPLFAVIGYLAGLIVLVVFGIWGFRLASKDNSGGNGGGGSKGPGASPAPPSGDRGLAVREHQAGRDHARDFAAWERQFATPESEPGPAERVSGQ
jgi:hypothetical protein